METSCALYACSKKGITSADFNAPILSYKSPLKILQIVLMIGFYHKICPFATKI